MPSPHMVSITRVLPCRFVLSTACYMTLFYFTSLCPISNLATLLHLWWRNVQARLRLITYKPQSPYRAWPVWGDTLWSYQIVKITDFWDFKPPLSKECGLGSVVGIATGYGLDGPGIESRWGARFSAPVQTGPGAHPASCTMGTGSFPGLKSGRGVTLTPHPLLVPLVIKE